MDALVDRHLRPARLRERLLADRAIGWIDETTRRMPSAAGKDRRDDREQGGLEHEEQD
ncbi:hypothetical protein QH494_03820 [Sphingomonas sp. AR_OL41]|uniref:hypothetical protein n=1 Tax=Sphingomonas sp. AR_OL41 TaxID=3042729 RepID=UPI00247FAC5C|nr:hypothetical protein [Sphingomonas sp. AR_OL41]MDH7971298.1 hypothetical protein [Sphingomonas sp. AR_OL41]